MSIASDLDKYGRSNWIVIAYLLTYSSELLLPRDCRGLAISLTLHVLLLGFLIVFARLSDITGRKSALLISLSIFTMASLACGLAQTLIQLYVDRPTSNPSGAVECLSLTAIFRIIFRVFQGIGGAGIYALTMVLVAEIAPKRHFGAVYGMINLVFVAASAVGPVIGGAITTYSTWRWCFYLK